MLLTAIGLDGYELVRELSNSSTGRVSKAIADNNQKKAVAIRVLLPGPSTHSDIAILERNAQAARALNSPNIVDVRSVSQPQSSVCIVADYVEGSLLSTALEKGDLSDWDLGDLARQLCYAVDHAASHNVFHQNLHPGNILQEWDGNVKVLDYGVTVDPVQRANTDRSCLASLRYLSPEQAQGKSPDRRSNLFSIAVMLYQMATGEHLFPATESGAILDEIRNVVVPAPLKGGKLDPALHAVLAKALSRSPDERYATGADFLYALDHRQQRQTVVRPPEPKPAPPQPKVPQVAVEVTRPAAVSAPVRPVVSPPRAATIAPTIHAAPPASQRPVKLVQTPSPAKPPQPVKATPASPQAPPAAAAVPTVQARPPKPEAPALKPTPRSEFLIVGPKPQERATVQMAPETKVPQAAPVAAPSPAVVPAAPKKTNRLVLWIAAGAFFFLLVAVALAGVLVWTLKRVRVEPQVQVQQPAPEQQASIPAETVQVEGPVVDTPTTVPGKKQKKAAQTTAVAAPVTGTIYVGSTPPGAAIEVDGQATGFVTPHAIFNMSAGSHTVRLSKPGYDTVTRTAQVSANQVASLDLSLPELRATVSITSDPDGATVLINGEKLAKATPVTVALLKGNYTVSLQKQGYVASESTVAVTPGQTYKIAPHMARLGDATAVREVGKLKKLFGGGRAVSDMGKLQFKTTPKGAQVTVNGTPMKKQTPTELFFPAGHYEIVISLPGYKPVHRTASVVQDSTQSIEVQLEREAK